MQSVSKEEFEKKYGATAVAKLDQVNEQRRSQSFMPTTARKPLVNRFTEVMGLGGATDVFGRLMARQGIGTDVSKEITQEFVEKPTGTEVAGAVAQTAAIPAGFVLTGGSSVPAQIAAGASLGYIYDVGSDLASGKSVSEAAMPGTGTAAGALVPPALRGAAAGVGKAFQGAKNLITGATETVAESGAGQVAKEAAKNVPRAIEKTQELFGEAAQRAERIKNAPPKIRNAIEARLDDVVIAAVETADEPTKQAYRQMVQLAEAPRTGLRPAVRPESVAGEAVSEQYKILNTKRKEVGQRLGDAVDALSQKGPVDILPAQRSMRDLLRTNGILPDVSGKLDFSTSSLTPKQQALVQQLYETSTRSEKLTPRQIYNMDKLMSQLQREARFEGLDNVYLSTPEGDINVFRAFKNIFSNHLDNIAPEIKPINREYAQLRNLQDDIEDSIVKRGNFESTKDVDPAEFAQTNLRRIFSDAQSAADYRMLADKLDALARANNYTGANPQDLAGFAQRLRQIYPETVPETSFQGGITGGIKNVFEKVLDFGAPDVRDQQKALKELLEAT